jgi:hypothetical protein
VGGVVNFITDKKFNGIKGNIQTGISTYGDDTSALLQVAGGTGFAGGKGHIEASAEFYRNDGVPAANTVGGALTNGRCCNLNYGTLSYTTATTPAGQPEFTPVLNIQSTSQSEYGLITSGNAYTAATPGLKGLAFDAQGNLAPFQSNGFLPGTPGCVGNSCVGGDLPMICRPRPRSTPPSISAMSTPSTRPLQVRGRPASACLAATPRLPAGRTSS